METKKATYRYDEFTTGALIEKGIAQYKRYTHTGNLSLNGFIDLAIEKTMVEFPQQVERLSDELREKKKEISALKEENEKMLADYKRLKNLIKYRNEIEDELKKITEE